MHLVIQRLAVKSLRLKLKLQKIQWQDIRRRKARRLKVCCQKTWRGKFYLKICRQKV